MNKLVVIMSIYAEPVEMIEAAIESILNQTYKNFYFIIINDNPNRECNKNLLKTYIEKDSRIMFFSNEVNIGLTKSLNYAASKLPSTFIARMDADDISEPLRFEKQLAILENNEEIDICGSCVNVIDEHNNITGFHVYPKRSSEIKSKLFFRDCICHPATMFRRSLFDETNGYSDEFEKAQDYDLWIKSLIMGKGFYNIQEPLLRYRMHSNNISTKNVGEQTSFSIKAKIKLYKEFLPDEDYVEIVNYINGNDSKLKLYYVLRVYLKLSRILSKKINGYSNMYFLSLVFKRISYLKFLRKRVH